MKDIRSYTLHNIRSVTEGLTDRQTFETSVLEVSWAIQVNYEKACKCQIMKSKLCILL